MALGSNVFANEMQPWGRGSLKCVHPKYSQLYHLIEGRPRISHKIEIVIDIRFKTPVIGARTANNCLPD